MDNKQLIDKVVRILLPQTDDQGSSTKTANIDGIWYQDGLMRFTLPALYQMSGSSSDFTYNAFRQAIYSSNINEQLAQSNYKIDVYDSKGKVDTTVYQVIRI